MTLSFPIMLALATQAAAVPAPAQLFVGAVSLFCLTTGAVPATIRSRVEEFKGVPVSPAQLPQQSPTYLVEGKAYTLTDAWRLERGGLTFWVATVDVPDLPGLRHCEVMAWDLNTDDVDAVFRGHRRAADDPAGQNSVQVWNDPRATVTVTWMERDGRRLQVASVRPRP